MLLKKKKYIERGNAYFSCHVLLQVFPHTHAHTTTDNPVLTQFRQVVVEPVQRQNLNPITSVTSTGHSPVCGVCFILTSVTTCDRFHTSGQTGRRSWVVKRHSGLAGCYYHVRHVCVLSVSLNMHIWFGLPQKLKERERHQRESTCYNKQIR